MRQTTLNREQRHHGLHFTPYCVCPKTPDGNLPLSLLPHLQVRFRRLYSMTSRRGSGNSKTCRVSTISASPIKLEAPHWQLTGSQSTTKSGSSTICKVFPECRSCPPRRPFFLAKAGFGLLNPSLDGGRFEFCEFSFTRASNSSIFACMVSMTDKRWRIKRWHSSMV